MGGRPYREERDGELGSTALLSLNVRNAQNPRVLYMRGCVVIHVAE